MSAGDLTRPALLQVQRADVYVSSQYGGWQERLLRWLAAHYDEAGNSFSKEATSGLIEEVRTLGLLRGVA